MKRMITVTFVILLFGVPVMAQGGLIGLFIDTWGDECCIVDIDKEKIRIIEVQVVHKFAPEAGAAQFSIQASDGFTGVYLGEEIPASLPGGCIGNSQRGISIAYGACQSSPVHILTIRYYMYGTSAPMSYLEVVEDPTAIPPGINMVDCNHNPQMFPALGGRAYINNDGSINCKTTTPTRTTTWGGIKALYAE
jgi:hypothetical protein